MKYELNEKHNDEKFNVSFEKHQYKIKPKAWTEKGWIQLRSECS